MNLMLKTKYYQCIEECYGSINGKKVAKLLVDGFVGKLVNPSYTEEVHIEVMRKQMDNGEFSTDDLKEARRIIRDIQDVSMAKLCSSSLNMHSNSTKK